jgi:hypothetical protein
MNPCRCSYLFDSVTQVAVDVFGNAFGNALGNSLADELGRGSQQEDRAGQAGGMTMGDFARMDGASYRSTPYDAGAAWMADVAGRRAANPMYTPALAQDELLGGRDDVNGMDLQSDQYAGGRRAITIGKNQGVLGAFGSAGLSAADQRSAYGQLIRTGQLTAADFDAKGTPIVRAGQEFYLDSNDYRAGDARLGGRLIGVESGNRAAIEVARANAEAAAEQARYDAMRSGAWSGRTSQLGAGAGPGAAGVLVADSQGQMPYGEQMRNVGQFFANGAVGVAEMIGGGIYNYGVRLAGGAASVPYLMGSVDAAVAVQEGVKERFGYEMRSNGAQAISQALQPVGQWLQSSVAAPVRAYSESVIGDGATTILHGHRGQVLTGIGVRASGSGLAKPQGIGVRSCKATSTGSICYIFHSCLSNQSLGHSPIWHQTAAASFKPSSPWLPCPPHPCCPSDAQTQSAWAVVQAVGAVALAAAPSTP